MDYGNRLVKFNLVYLILGSPLLFIYFIYKETTGYYDNFSFVMLLSISTVYFYIFTKKSIAVIEIFTKFYLKKITLKLLFLSVSILYLGQLILANLDLTTGYIFAFISLFILFFAEFITLWWKPNADNNDVSDTAEL